MPAMTLAFDGSAADKPMKNLFVIDDDSTVLLETWNEVTGEAQEDQEWTLHLKMTATYPQAASTTH